MPIGPGGFAQINSPNQALFNLLSRLQAHNLNAPRQAFADLGGGVQQLAQAISGQRQREQQMDFQRGLQESGQTFRAGESALDRTSQAEIARLAREQNVQAELDRRADEMEILAARIEQENPVGAANLRKQAAAIRASRQGIGRTTATETGPPPTEKELVARHTKTIDNLNKTDFFTPVGEGGKRPVNVGALPSEEAAKAAREQTTAPPQPPPVTGRQHAGFLPVTSAPASKRRLPSLGTFPMTDASEVFKNDNEARSLQNLVAARIRSPEMAAVLSDPKIIPNDPLLKVYRNILVDLIQGADEERALSRALERRADGTDPKLVRPETHTKSLRLFIRMAQQYLNEQDDAQ